VFHTHAREALTFNYGAIPLILGRHNALTLEVDDYGNVRRSAAIAYGRRQPDVARSQPDRERQALSHITCEEHEFTNAIDLPDGYPRAACVREPAPTSWDAPDVTPVSPGVTFDLVLDAGEAAGRHPHEQTLDPNQWQKRLIAHARTQYRPDDLGEARGDALALLPLGQLESRALPGERYQLALTSGLVATVLGDRVSDAMLGSESGYVHTAVTATGGRRRGACSFRHAPTTRPRGSLPRRRGISSSPGAFGAPSTAPDSRPSTSSSYERARLSSRAKQRIPWPTS
jgi:hypothetical protein